MNSNFRSTLCLVLSFLLVLCAGCSTLQSALTAPTVLQDATGAIVAAIEATTAALGVAAPAALPAAVPMATGPQIQAAAKASLKNADNSRVTVAFLSTALPGAAPAVQAWAIQNPAGAQVAFTQKQWLAAVVQATTAGTPDEARVRARLIHPRTP